MDRQKSIDVLGFDPWTQKYGAVVGLYELTPLRAQYILDYLYGNVLNVRSKDPNWPGRDYFILSKGHGCLALYSLLVIQGYVDKKELLTFGKKGSRLGGHPDRNKLDKIYASTGALGHGFPIAVGTAMAKKILKKVTAL